jgi:hypothetical protein
MSPGLCASAPCPFLKDKRCAVYEHRPANCRSYPYLDRPEFTARPLGMFGRLLPSGTGHVTPYPLRMHTVSSR